MRISVNYLKHLLEVIDLNNLDEFTGQQLVALWQSHDLIADDLFQLHYEALLDNDFLDSRQQNNEPVSFHELLGNLDNPQCAYHRLTNIGRAFLSR